MCYVEPSSYGHVWIDKQYLYPNYREQIQGVSHSKSCELHTDTEDILVCNIVSMQHDDDIVSNVAYTSAKTNCQIDYPWYFDSGFSRHMTGNQEYIENLEHIKGRKVTFGDGAQGKIRGVGVTKRADLPRLINVYYVDGLRANLISVSQLCDDGFEVIFNRKECRAVDAEENIIMYGVRS